ncbi:MAG TPA: hypothetical protein DCE41_13785 [Cytophagales bacterium]|nr:hypothetical protein [Cytophagales bacterium]
MGRWLFIPLAMLLFGTLHAQERGWCMTGYIASKYPDEDLETALLKSTDVVLARPERVRSSRPTRRVMPDRYMNNRRETRLRFRVTKTIGPSLHELRRVRVNRYYHRDSWDLSGDYLLFVSAQHKGQRNFGTREVHKILSIPSGNSEAQYQRVIEYQQLLQLTDSVEQLQARLAWYVRCLQEPDTRSVGIVGLIRRVPEGVLAKELTDNQLADLLASLPPLSEWHPIDWSLFTAVETLLPNQGRDWLLDQYRQNRPQDAYSLKQLCHRLETTGLYQEDAFVHTRRQELEDLSLSYWDKAELYQLLARYMVRVYREIGRL